MNGKVVTMDCEGRIAQAIGIDEGKIVAIGNNEEILSLKKSHTKIIDLDDKLVLPGFNDSHIHMLNYGYTSRQLALGDCKSIKDLVEASKKYIREKAIQRGKWLLGRGWNQDYFIEKRFPTRHDLDNISLDHPICLTRTCGHMAVANSIAIDIAKKLNRNINNENIDWDLGIFKEDAINALYEAVTIPSIEEIKSDIVSAANDFLKSGITSVQSDDLTAMPDRDFKKVIKAYEELIKEGRLPIRVYEQCLLPDVETLNEFLRLGYRTGVGSEKFKIGPLKLLVDGSLGARTARLCDNYDDDSSTKGVLLYSQDELNELVLIAHKNNMQIAIHAIGDKAMYMVLESIRYAKEQFNREDSRHGIVHCQITDEKILDGLKNEEMLAYIQPIFLDYDLHIVEDRVGKEKAKKTYNWKTMIDKGIKVSGGSDAPVVAFNVLENIYSAVTRMDLREYPQGGWLPEQKLSVEEAVRIFTINGAHASFEENIKGSLEIGKLADMVVLSEDIFTIDEERIKDASVAMTIVDGRIVYEV